MTDTTRTCEKPSCTKPAKLQCPTCLKLKISPSYFCSQTCFKSCWSTHKSRHVKPLQNRPEFRNYKSWTGKLRPYPLTKSQRLPPEIPRPDYAKNLGGTPQGEIDARGKPIPIWSDPKDVEGLREAGRLGAEVLALAGKVAKPGVTTDEIDRVVHDACIERGCYPSPLNYRGFRKSVCTSVNEVICHGIPDLRPLEDGDILNVDVTVYTKNGFHGDLNETWLIGEVEERYKKLVKTTYECLEKAIEIVKPNTMYREIGSVISRHAQKNGFSVVKAYCGHGIGDLFHTNPSVPHYARNKAVGFIKEGHCFTIEPMINEGDWRADFWPDDWTAVTKDGMRSAQFEHTLLVTKDGCEILTKRKQGSYIDRF